VDRAAQVDRVHAAQVLVGLVLAALALVGLALVGLVLVHAQLAQAGRLRAELAVCAPAQLRAAKNAAGSEPHRAHAGVQGRGELLLNSKKKSVDLVYEAGLFDTRFNQRVRAQGRDGASAPRRIVRRS
jgi:hypothetical protein